MSAAHQVPVVPKVDKSLPKPTVAARGPAVRSKLLTDRSWGNAADAGPAPNFPSAAQPIRAD